MPEIIRYLTVYWTPVFISIICVVTAYYIIVLWIKVDHHLNRSPTVYLWGLAFLIWGLAYIIVHILQWIGFGTLQFPALYYVFNYLIIAGAMLLFYRGAIRLFTHKVFWKDIFTLLYFCGMTVALFLIRIFLPQKSWFSVYAIAFFAFVPLEIILLIFSLKLKNYFQRLTNRKSWVWILAALAWLILIIQDIYTSGIEIFSPFGWGEEGEPRVTIWVVTFAVTKITAFVLLSVGYFVGGIKHLREILSQQATRKKKR